MFTSNRQLRNLQASLSLSFILECAFALSLLSKTSTASVTVEIFVQGSGSAAQGEISFLSWNSKVQHILASTSYNGTTGEKRKRPLIYIFY